MMKKTLILVFVLMATSAFAAPKYRGTSEALRVPGTATVQVFDNVSTIDQAVLVNPAFLPDQGTMQLVLNGSPAVHDVVVECSIISDTGPWFVLLSLANTDAVPNGGHYALKSCQFVQIRLEALDTGSVDAYIVYRGN